ncbi:hypothetical protein QWY75_09400 [Pontixanthobacter aestiaquae]|uniref:Nucleotide modification associated domain-containing protein n=1 Tax=Pontixanthobacter aestiaquae TaxID=1509367 RepID=A0A844Z4F5_9SPHN|nr:hypothetical protein [Pontixanthobacter aestiaquae]MDN3646412.1 hypothetical protein [Pontixanthobacter aestiaquae]MXO82598.1 hypothetical protein [Pontixanthobacter aestiaquae]
MKIIFSRKGFDSAAGGGASPIVDGCPISLPIPSAGHSVTTYGDLGLGEHVKVASRGKLGATDFCHHDPMFRADGMCLFGQHAAAQTHLANQGVGVGDVFVFFGLFREEATGEPHHRIFGYQVVEEIVDLVFCDDDRRAELAAMGHPHALGMHSKNDMIYIGRGDTAKANDTELRLTVPDGPPSLWNRPDWLMRGGLSYHDRADRWIRGGKLRSVARGQEFVADIGRRKAPRDWLDHIIAVIGRS